MIRSFKCWPSGKSISSKPMTSPGTPGNRSDRQGDPLLGKDIVLSLSPGGQTTPEFMDVYQQANMLRTTRDIWDNRDDLDKAFDVWHAYSEFRKEGFWLDLDMIPFGHLQLWNPRTEAKAYAETRTSQELSGKGHERMSGLSVNQKYTFITIRALAASPLFMGGDLPSSDEFSIDLITNEGMLECNQNGISGSRVYAESGIEVWKTLTVRPRAKAGSVFLTGIGRPSGYS